MFVFKAFCETLEETNYRFQKELLEKQKEVESLKKLLSEKQLHIEALEGRLRCAEALVGPGRPGGSVSLREFDSRSRGLWGTALETEKIVLRLFI